MTALPHYVATAQGLTHTAYAYFALGALLGIAIGLLCGLAMARRSFPASDDQPSTF